MDTKFPDVFVQLVGTDGNAFSIIGKVRRALIDAGHSEGASEFTRATDECESYDDLLQLVSIWVEVL